MRKFDVDLFVIGAGSGGVRASRIAASHGARVALAEEYRVGGTCVIRGCVPKKLLVYASRYRQELQSAASYGWAGAGGTFDWSTLQQNVADEVARLESVYSKNLEKAGVELLHGRARLQDAHTVLVEGRARPITAERILISTGARPSVPADLPGVEYALTSDDVFTLPEMPKRIVIGGGGYIAVEFAGIFSQLGAETRLVHRADRILRGFDEGLREGLDRAYRKIGIKFSTGVTLVGITKRGDTLEVRLSDGETIETDAVLLATGRTPNSANLGLDGAGVDLDKDGGICVDADFRTTAPSVFAVGDVTNQVQLTPVAIHDGHAFADSQFGKKHVVRRSPLVPSAVFSTPEAASVGLTEHAAALTVPDLKVFQTSFRPMRQGFAKMDTEFFAKILVDGATDKVLGVHLLGEGAAEMIQLVGVAMTAGATKSDFDRTLAVHPTIAEELVTMRTPSPRRGGQG